MKQLPERFSVYAETLEEAEYIVQKQGEICGTDYLVGYNRFYRFTPKKTNKGGYDSRSYLTMPIYNIEHEFTCEEFKKFFEKEEETFPIDNFGVIVENNAREVIDYLVSKGFENKHNFGNNKTQVYGIYKGENTIYASDKNFKSFEKTYTLNQLKKLDKQMEMYSIKDLEEKVDLVVYLDSEEEHIKLKKITNRLCKWSGKHCYSVYLSEYSSRSSKNNAGYYAEHYNAKIITINQIKKLNNMENKKIIGYKLIKPEYETAVANICHGCNSMSERFKEDKIIGFPSEASEKLKQAGVLNLWFNVILEPEKPKEVVVNMGSFNLTVKKEGIFHKSENIYAFVKNLVEVYSKLPMKFGSYDCIVNEITFKKTGCESTSTTLNQWQNVLEEYNKLQ